FFCQAEDGIRCRNVTGVQTCALPIFTISYKNLEDALLAALAIANPTAQDRRMMFAISLTWSSAISAVLNGRIDREEYQEVLALTDRKSTRLNSSHVSISYAVFCLKKK